MKDTIEKVIVKDLDDNIEELVKIKVNEWELTCFASVSPYSIEIGKTYMVDITLMIFDQYMLLDNKKNESYFEQIDDGFSYIVYGKLNGGYLQIGSLSFYDESFLSDFYYLDGQYIALKVDRIDLAFL